METRKPGPPLRVAGAALAKGQGSFQSSEDFLLLATAGCLSAFPGLSTLCVPWGSASPLSGALITLNSLCFLALCLPEDWLCVPFTPASPAPGLAHAEAQKMFAK